MANQAQIDPVTLTNEEQFAYILTTITGISATTHSFKALKDNGIEMILDFYTMTFVEIDALMFNDGQGNGLAGAIPEEIRVFRRLDDLGIYHNANLKGNLDLFSHFSSLRAFQLRSNDFSVCD